MGNLITNTQYDEIISIYAARQSENARIRNKRKEEIYAKIPRIQEIDTEIKQASIRAARERMQKKISESEYKKNVSGNLGLIKEKKRLLQENGYPSDYMENVYTCPDCQDTGMIQHKDRESERCHCFNQMLIQKIYTRSMIDHRFEYENFDKFCLDFYSDRLIAGHKFTPRQNMEGVLKRVHRYIDEFGENGGSLLLTGEPGLGKTFLVSCIAKAIMDQRKTVLYQSAADLFEDLKDAKSGWTHDTKDIVYKDFVESCDLLILDDLGTEINSSLIQSLLYSIINKRMRNEKAIIISTNLSLEEIHKKYSERISSRIMEGFVILPFYGENIRYKKLGV